VINKPAEYCAGSRTSFCWAEWHTEELRCSI